MVVGLLLTSGLAVKARAATDVLEDDDNQFREDVILCEEAVAHAALCCGFGVPAKTCSFYHYEAIDDDCGCDSPRTTGREERDVWPALSASLSPRIIDASCEEMKARPATDPTSCEGVKALVMARNERASSTPKRCP